MKNRIIKIFTFCALLGAGTVTLAACETYGESRSGNSESTTETDVLSKVDAQWTLPSELREVSGIALLEDNLMACVQDEEGAIYIYDLQQKTVKEKIPFAGRGDYEGIAINGTTAYILRSDGAILELENFRYGKPNLTEHKSILAGTQDTEGLAYDQKNNRLLVACKGYDEKLGDTKGIYAFSLTDKKMQNEPIISIPLAQEQLKAAKKKKKNLRAGLQPSSLEIHPVTGELYMLDAANSRLLILNEQGTISKTVDLDKNLFKQAEGLSFGTNGEMYIASESGGKKGDGIIVKYQQGL